MSEKNRMNCVSLEGDWTIERAAELKDLLLERLDNERGLCLDLSSVGATDITFWQVLRGLKNMATQEELDIVLKGGLPDDLEQDLEELGIDRENFAGMMEEDDG